MHNSLGRLQLLACSRKIEAGSAGGFPMIALRLVKLIETHSEELAEGLTRKLLSSERTRDMRKVPAHELHHRCHEIYRNLSDWLLTKTEKDVETVYKDLAGRRAQQGVSLASLTWALF